MVLTLEPFCKWRGPRAKFQGDMATVRWDHIEYIDLLNPEDSADDAAAQISSSPHAEVIDIRDQLSCLQHLILPSGPILVSATTANALSTALREITHLPATLSPSGHSQYPVGTLSSCEENVQITRKRMLDILIHHEDGAVIEFPQTSRTGCVGHLFKCDPENWITPVENVVYAQGSPRGRSAKDQPVKCEVLRDGNGMMVLCQEKHSTCQGLKICPCADAALLNSTHTSATREDLKNRLRRDREQQQTFASPMRLVFEKTLGRIAAYRKYGCGASINEHAAGSSYQAVSDEDWLEHQHLRAAQEKGRRGYQLTMRRCEGRLLYLFDYDGEPFVQCEHYSRQNRTHLLDYTIRNGSYDLEYLEAALTDDYESISRLEYAAQEEGYGPLAVCNTLANFTSNRVHCPCEHRDEDEHLIPQEMLHLSCTSKLQVFEPLSEFRTACPYVLLVCQGEHTHPIPLPTNTPAHIRAEIFHMLESVGHDLPDMTPRRFLRHPVVLARVHELLPHICNPTLSDLHVSLANREHLRSYIKKAKEELFPQGTGWEGLRHLKAVEDATCSPEDTYIRYMAELSEEALNAGEEFISEDLEGQDSMEPEAASDKMRIIICMTKEQSRRLIKAQYLQSDIAFKRVVGYKEFELGGWDGENKTAIVYCRILLTRETAAAHCFIFHKIDAIVKDDTGSSLCWRHLHARSLDDFTGILQWTADQHLGQAKGLGLYLQHLASQLPPRLDLHEPHRHVTELSLYEHLHRIFRLCVVHVFRNIKSCAVSDEVKKMMRSLVCLEHDDWDGTVAEIRNQGGRAAVNWIEDKIRSHFAFEGICWSKSMIPLEIWQAGERNSNLIESQHADVNREGVACSLVGGIVRGHHLDMLKLRTLKALEDAGVEPSFQFRGSAEKAYKSLKTQQAARRKGHLTHDSKITAANTALRRRTKTMLAAQRRLDSTSQSHASTHLMTRKENGANTMETARHTLLAAESAHQRAVEVSTVLAWNVID
ncbi:hypothetical protein SCP_0113720 [Sparassis crispa]|uniref:Uncharacterized protein n=1 Tax=Sparassis crispa TaxID=139825 RepID=A0A401G8L9_9APHY|nr:hypothetical protein SCP_0113720 [Sparassis crispa]GBE78483.1 hypothetical protein SCP_0113720 [Sparassis crispa]